MRIINKIMWWANILIAICLILSYVATEINPMDFWPLSFFGLSYPLLLIANILMILYWLFAKPWRALLSFLCILLGWNLLGSFINVNSTSHSNTPHALNVMTYNLSNMRWAYDKDKKLRKIKVSEVLSFLNEQKVDIMCTQETGAFANDILNRVKGLDNSHVIKGKGAAIWTKYPIAKSGYVDFGTITNSCLWADIALAADTIRVYSAHFYSNRISKESEAMLAGENSDNRETLNSLGSILQKYKIANQKRSVQVALVKKHIEKSPYPVLLMGDFNDPPSSYTYSTLSFGMKDAFIERGVGVSSTYAGPIPLLRIDYILASKDFVVLDYQLLKEPYSDHYPVLSKVVLEERSK